MAIPQRRQITPLYYQIEQELLRQIRAGELQPGDQLPTETQLSNTYHVSRITARRAVENLTQQGMVYSRQGKGSFVAERRIRDLSGFRSYSDDILSLGLRPASRVLEFVQASDEDEVISRLKLPEGESYYRLQRVRLAEGEPVAVETAYLPARLFPGLQEYDFGQLSLFEVLRNRYQIFPTWADAVLEASAATPEIARQLGMKVNEPVLLALRQSFTASFEVVEFVRSVYCGRRFTFYTGRQYIG
jgi:GntR family transcriptional regulator